MTAQFSPAQHQIGSILDAICDPARSLLSIAQEVGAPLHALCAWLDLPEVAASIEQMSQSCARRVRLLASTQMSLVLETARALVAGLARDEAALAAQPPDPKSLALRRSARQAGLGAMRLMHKLSTFGAINSRPASRRSACRTDPVSETAQPASLRQDSGRVAPVPPPTRSDGPAGGGNFSPESRERLSGSH